MKDKKNPSWFREPQPTEIFNLLVKIKYQLVEALETN